MKNTRPMKVMSDVQVFSLRITIVILLVALLSILLSSTNEHKEPPIKTYVDTISITDTITIHDTVYVNRYIVKEQKQIVTNEYDEVEDY